MQNNELLKPHDSKNETDNTVEGASCFVIMPFSDPEGYDKGHFKKVYEDIFFPACKIAGFRAIRGDEVNQANLIHLDILQKLIETPMAICDLSSRNPNVLFELGLRQAFDKPVILVQEIGNPAIFDIAPFRYVEYRRELRYREVLEDQLNIAKAITATYDAYIKGNSVNSIVRLLSITQPATLSNVEEDDKESAILQLILSEIGNIKSDLKTIRSGPSDTFAWSPNKNAPRSTKKGRLLQQIMTLENDINDFKGLIDKSNSLDINSVEFTTVFNSIYERLANLKQQARSSLDDESMEYIALLENQIKVLWNRQKPYINSTDANLKIRE